jgi:3-ketosteroid 9alpha-monooxygenase subunit A
MAKPPLSMKPTGWFQVAWSDEIGVGDVHTMKYFDREMVAWRAESGGLTVMDAYCEHLGAHLGFGGKVVGEALQCPFHGWQWSQEGRNVRIPCQDRPNRGRRIRTYPAVERNESVYIWHDVERRAPYFDAPDVFASFDDGRSEDDYYPQQRLYRQGLELHPQYVLENGVDFAHFKFVHNTPIVPVFTRHDFADAVSFVDFTITFEGDEGQKIEDVNSGVEAINGGLGVAVTKSWGMVDNRTISAVTPVDESTSDVRFMVCIGRAPGKDPARAELRAAEFGREVIRQFEQDIEIWRHQRYSDPPALAPDEYEGFTAIRKWAKQFYAASQKG